MSGYCGRRFDGRGPPIPLDRTVAFDVFIVATWKSQVQGGEDDVTLFGRCVWALLLHENLRAWTYIRNPANCCGYQQDSAEFAPSLSDLKPHTVTPPISWPQVLILNYCWCIQQSLWRFDGLHCIIHGWRNEHRTGRCCTTNTKLQGSPSKAQ